MKRYRVDAKEFRQLTPAEAQRLNAMPIDYSDLPPLGNEFFSKAKETWPPITQQLTIRLDADVLQWLKAYGRGYQTRINRILRAAMESQPPRRSRSTATRIPADSSSGVETANAAENESGIPRPLEARPNINALLSKAISEKRLLRLRYKNSERVVEPHDYGIHKGKIKLLAYQVGGSSSHQLPNWRRMEQDLISDIHVLDGTFRGGRPAASRKHHRWEKIFIRVKPAEKNKKQRLFPNP